MDPEPLAPIVTYEDLAGIIDHSLVRPELTNQNVVEGLETAKRYRVASAIVRPCDIDLAVRTLQGSPVRPGSVCGFPHGTAGTATKLYELRDLLRRGAKEIEMVVAIPKLLSREFQHVQTELDQAAESCNQGGAILKVILETGMLTRELKIIACLCCDRAGVDFAVTSTGFAPADYTADDLKLMREHLPEEVGLKAVGGLDTLDQVMEARALGCSRIGTAATAGLLDEWKARLATVTPAPA
jgi:deoxyribose-phosphate aldolase